MEERWALTNNLHPSAQVLITYSSADLVDGLLGELSRVRFGFLIPKESTETLQPLNHHGQGLGLGFSPKSNDRN